MSFRTIAITAACLTAFAACDDDAGMATTDATDTSSDASSDADASQDAVEDTTGDATEDVEPDTGPECPAPTGQRPARRSEHAGIYDPVGQQVVIYGGSFAVPVQCNFPAATFESEVWAYDTRCGSWRRIEASGGPGGRVRHMAAYDSQEHRMLVFGGRYRKGDTGAYTLYNDLWAFDLTTETWSEIDVPGQRPIPRVNGAFVYDATHHRLVLFGGNASTSGAFYDSQDDVWTFDLNTNTWSELTVAGGPGPRLFMGHLWDEARQRLIIHHGGDDSALDFTQPADYFDDLWMLDLSGEQPVWWLLDDQSQLRPVGRFWGSLIHDTASDRYVLFGGHDNGNAAPDVGNRNDLWYFNPTTLQWTQERAGDTWNAPALDFCLFPPDFTVVDAASPERRSSAVFVAGTGQAWVVGGKTDCGVVDDLWRLDLSDLSWHEETAATVGEVCIRRGGVNCNDMCF